MRFKEVDTDFEKKLLKDIENIKIEKVYKVEKGILFQYKKNDEIKYLSIIHKIYKEKNFFNLERSDIEEKEEHEYLKDIDTISKIFCLEDEEDYRIEIIYTDKNKIVNSYALTFEDDGFIFDSFSIRKYENIFNFKVGDIEFSYDYIYFHPKTVSDYYLDYPICIGRKVRFEIDESFGVRAYDISTLSEYITLVDKEKYELLNKIDKQKLEHFCIIAQFYIRNLLVNQELNKMTLNEIEKIELLGKTLEEQSWNKTLLYANGEQGHPSTKEIFVYSKNGKKLIWFWEIEYYGDEPLVTLKFNDDIKDELNEILKSLGIEEFKRVEVWYEDNYEILKHEAIEYFRKSFNTKEEAVEYIKNKLDEELIEFINTDKNITLDELISRYKMYGSDFYLKNSFEGFSSWSYIDENAKRIYELHKKEIPSIIEDTKKVEKKREESKTKKTKKPFFIIGTILLVVVLFFVLTQDKDKSIGQNQVKIEQPKEIEKIDKYLGLLNKDVKSLSEIELFNILQELYKIDAFTSNEAYIYKIFDELVKNRPLEKTKDMNVNFYQIRFALVVHLLTEKKKLNEILKKYEKGVVYTFIFWKYKPEYDLEHSHLRFVDLKRHEVKRLWHDNIEKIDNIEIVENKIKINQKDKTRVDLGTFEKDDLEEIKKSLFLMIRDIKLIENLKIKEESNDIHNR